MRQQRKVVVAVVIDDKVVLSVAMIEKSEKEVR
jgi:hypothetical protein